MISDLKPYGEYKESGVPWLGQVPRHWGLSRSKRLFSGRKDLALPEDVQLSATQAYGVIPQSDFEEKVGRRVVKISMHLEKRRHVERNDFVISMRSFQGGIERAWASGAIRSSYVVLKPESNVNIGFFAYLFKSHSYIRALQATADFIRDGQDLNFSNFCGVDLPTVPLAEQAGIVRFLDWASGRLERAIRAKRKVIALLNEQKQAIVHRAVTRGLDPSVPLRPSGIPWLGDIPQHWGTWRISRCARVGNGSTPSRGKPAYWNNGTYASTLDEDQQVDFKGKAKAFTRSYDFLASVMPYTRPEWERLSILLNLLTPKLPAPKEDDLARGILEAIDMDSYRVEKKAAMQIALADADAQIEPVPVEGGGHKGEPELDRLSNILKTFNENFGTLFTDTDRVAKRIRDDIAPKVAADTGYQNAKENTPHTARMAHDQALGKVMQHLLKDDTQVYKQFVENESFRRFVGDMVYALTSQ